MRNKLNKSKNGFTIIELVVVMTIILLITATSVVSYSRITRNYREKEYNKIISNFEAAAEAYAAENQEIRDRIYSGTGYATVTLKVLSNEGLIDDDVEDPITGEKFDEKNYVTVFLDENRNLFAIYMRETGSSFTNSRAKQSILAGSLYSRIQMLEYIVGFVRGDYDETSMTYGNKEIDYSLIDIKITDITDDKEVVLDNNTIVPTTREYIDHTFRIDYSYDFGDDGVKKLSRQVSVYNVAPTIKSLNITPDLVGSYTKDDITATASGESIHGTVTYHFNILGKDVVQESNTAIVTDNGVISVYVEDPYGWKSETLTRTISTIDKTPPTFDFDTTQDVYYGMWVGFANAKDTQSGIPSKSVKYPGSNGWTYLGRTYLNRNGEYTFTLRDAAGNETSKTFTVENVILIDFSGKERADAQHVCDQYQIKCNFTGSSNQYATVTAQSISPDTPVTDGMVLNLTLTAPKTSIKVKVTNGSVNGEDFVTVDKGEGSTFEIVAYSGYQMSGASAVCGSGATASLSGSTLTISNVLTNVECQVTTYKTPVRYSGGSSSSGGGSSYCGQSCILQKMKENGSKWGAADAANRERLHNENVKLAEKLGGMGRDLSFTNDGYWRDKSGSPVPELYGKKK